MKNYQNLIGLLLIAISILIVGVMVSNSIHDGFTMIFTAIGSLGEYIRDGLIQSP